MELFLEEAGLSARSSTDSMPSLLFQEARRETLRHSDAVIRRGSFLYCREMCFEDESQLFESKLPGADAESPPASAQLKPFWLLRLLQRTIKEGAFVSRSLYVSRAVWKMEGARLPGLSAQVAALEQLLSLLNIAFLPLPGSLPEATAALHKFKAFTLELRLLQNSLARPFPFIPEVEVEAEAPQPAADEPGKPSDLPFQLFGGRVVVPRALAGISRLGDMVSTVGKSVRRYAETGFQRLNALPAKVSAEELAYLVSVVSNVCLRCEGLERWVLFLEQERAEEAVAAGLSASERAAWRGAVESLVFELAFVSSFLMQAVGELLLRDLEVLAMRYMKKLRKSFLVLAGLPDEDNGGDNGTAAKEISPLV